MEDLQFFLTKRKVFRRNQNTNFLTMHRLRKLKINWKIIQSLKRINKD